MAQTTTGLTDEAINGTLTHVEVNTIKNTVDNNSTDAESRLTALEGGKEDDLGNPAADNQVLASTILGARSWISVASGANLQWALDQFGVPVFNYPTANVSVSDSGTLTPVIEQGGPVESFSVTAGSLPTGFALDANTGEISYTTSAATESGTFGITAVSPAGASAEFTMNYNIKTLAGRDQFLNNEWVYPAVRVDTSNSKAEQVLRRQLFSGRTTGVANGTLIADPTYPVYAASNGDGTWNYLMYVTSGTFWTYFKNSTTDPATLTDTLSTDIRESVLGVNYVAPVSRNVVVGGINYPSARDELHWLTTGNFIEFGTAANLDGFMSNDFAWSYGFQLVDPIPRDGLGRTMFSRGRRSFHSFHIAHIDKFSDQVFGSGTANLEPHDPVAALPGPGFAAGTFIRVTHAANGLIEIFANGIKYFSCDSAGIFDPAASLNTGDVRFGTSVNANHFQANNTTYSGGWQGRIERLWISNGVVETTDDNGATYPASASHTWELTESTGKNFIATTGGVNGVGITAQ